MTTYEHEVKLVVKFKTTKKITSKAELKRIAQQLEHSGLNNTRTLGVVDASREPIIYKMNKVVEE